MSTRSPTGNCMPCHVAYLVQAVLTTTPSSYAGRECHRRVTIYLLKLCRNPYIRAGGLYGRYHPTVDLVTQLHTRVSPLFGTHVFTPGCSIYCAPYGGSEVALLTNDLVKLSRNHTQAMLSGLRCVWDIAHREYDQHFCC